MINFQYKDKKIGILGLGKTGISMLNFFLASKANVIVQDDNKKTAENQITANKTPHSEVVDNSLEINEKDTNPCYKTIDINEIDYLAISPGIDGKKHSLVQEAVIKNVPVISDIDLLYQINPIASYIGITGTNGKSTTTNLIHHIISKTLSDKKKQNNVNLHKVQMGGNIGIPVLSMEATNNINSAYILELSSYQIDLLHKMKLNVAVFLNLTPDHLDRYGNMANYAKSKEKLLYKSKHIVISDDYIESSEVINNLRSFQHLQSQESITAHIIPFSVNHSLNYGVTLIDNILNVMLEQKDHAVKIENMNIKKYIALSLLGKHNAENIAAAIAVCLLYNMQIDHILEQIQSYQALPHRMEIVNIPSRASKESLNSKHTNIKTGIIENHSPIEKLIKSILWINDSKATNTVATQYALNSFHNIHWLVGGLAKERSILHFKKYSKNIICAYLIGSSTDQFAQDCTDLLIPYKICYTLENAMNSIEDEIKKGKMDKNATVLLSPACASTDQWTNFEARGDYFVNRVKKLLLENV